MNEELYRFHWRSGPPSEVMATGPQEAFTKLGYGAGAVAALDYWEVVREKRTTEPQSEGHTP